jgi:predicted ATPase
MLEYLHLKNVGPAPEIKMALGERLNLITGDNGLGKSFLLDVAWWALTRRWPQDLNRNLTSGYPARPSDAKKAATIEFRLRSKTKSLTYESLYSKRDEAWTGKAGRPWNPGLVVYAHADGGFSVWDPARNYWKTRGNVDIQERLPGYVFSAKQVWDGLEVNVDGTPTVVCNGLIRDWASWIREKGDDAENMASVLERLSPSHEPQDILRPGPLTRLSVDDARDTPSLETPYSAAVPILHASAGVKRIVALAYMLLWTWREHRIAASRIGERSAPQVVMLVDELESHLHPRWQRSILSSVLSLASALHGRATIQLLTATHSPLVLASAEPGFDPEKDSWFDLDLDTSRDNAFAHLRKRKFVRHGDVSNWLRSEAFDLKEARSLEAENAIVQALALARESKPKASEIKRVDGLLSKSLGEIDRFWMRWTEFKRSHAQRRSRGDS